MAFETYEEAKKRLSAQTGKSGIPGSSTTGDSNNNGSAFPSWEEAKRRSQQGQSVYGNAGTSARSPQNGMRQRPDRSAPKTVEPARKTKMGAKKSAKDLLDAQKLSSMTREDLAAETEKRKNERDAERRKAWGLTLGTGGAYAGVQLMKELGKKAGTAIGEAILPKEPSEGIQAAGQAARRAVDAIDKVTPNLYKSAGAANHAYQRADAANRERTAQTYEELKNNPDFAARSKYDPERREGATDFAYKFVNEDDENISVDWQDDGTREAFRTGLFADENYRSVRRMTDEERAIFNYLYDPKDPSAATEYIRFIQPDLNRRETERLKTDAAAEAMAHPVRSSVRSIMEAPEKVGAFVGMAGDYLSKGEIDPNTWSGQSLHRISATRNAISEDIAERASKVTNNPVVSAVLEKAAPMVYGTLMSMGDNLMNMAVTGGNETATLLLMGTEAAADAIVTAKDRGLSDDRAFTQGMIAGGIEYITEKIGLDNLFDIILNGGKAGKVILRQMAAEGAEEGASDVLNLAADAIYDVLLGTEESEFKQSMREHMAADGLNEKQAFWEAMKDFGIDLGMDVAGGALSGLGFGVGGMATNRAASAYQSAQIGKELNAADAAQQVIEEGLSADESSNAYKSAAKLQERMNRAQQIREQIEAGVAEGTMDDRTAERMRAQAERLERVSDQAIGRQYVRNEQAVEERESASDLLARAAEEMAEGQLSQRTVRQIAKDRTAYHMLDIGEQNGDQMKTRRRQSAVRDALRTAAAEVVDSEQRREADRRAAEQVKSAPADAVDRYMRQATERFILDNETAGERMSRPREAMHMDYLPRNDVRGAVSDGAEAAQAPQPKRQSDSARPRAAVFDGDRVQVAGIDHITDDGQISVRFEDGRTAYLEDVELSDRDAAQVYEAAATLGNEAAAKTFVAYYTGGNATRYATGFLSIYNAARGGASMQQAVRNSLYASSLSDTQRQAAFYAGQNAAAADRAGGDEKGKAGPGVRLLTNAKLSKTQQAQMDALDKAFRALGRTIEVVDRISYTDKDGNVHQSGANAYFDPETNTYRLSLDAVGEAYMYVAVHETVHDAFANNQKGSAALQEVVFKWLNELGQNTDQLVQDQMNLLLQRENVDTLSEDRFFELMQVAREEVVANTVPAILADETTGTQFAERFLNEDADTRSLFQRILDSILEFLQQAFETLSEQRSWQQMRKVSESIDAVTEIRAAYFDALEGVRESAREKSTNTASDDSVRYAIQETDKGKYVQFDRPVIRGTDSTKWGQQVTDYINNEIRHGRDVTVYAENGTPLTITEDTAGKAAFRNMIGLQDGSKRAMTDDEYAVKLRAETHIDELAQVSKGKGNTVPDRKSHAFAREGFNYRVAYFNDPTGYYRLQLSVGKNGRIQTIYNVARIEKTDFPTVGAQGSTRSKTETGNQFSANTMPQTEQNVNRENADIRYSLMEFEDGTRFVEIDQEQERFEGRDISEYPRIAKEIIKEKFVGKVIGLENRAFVSGDTRGEYVNSRKRITGDIYQAKMRAAGELDNLLDAGRNFRNEADGKDGHIHPQVIGGYDYFDTIFKIGDKYFEGVINVENVEKGKRLKDITKIKDVTKDISNTYGENPKFRFLRTSSMNNMPQNEGNVNKENNVARIEKTDFPTVGAQGSNRSKTETGNQFSANTMPQTEQNVNRENADIRYSAKSEVSKSIKEQLREHEAELRAMKPVATVSADTYAGLGKKQILNAVIADLGTDSYVIDREGFGKVKYGKNQINNGVEHLDKKNLQEEAAVLKAVPRIVKQGVVVGREENHGGVKQRTITFGAPIDIVRNESKDTYHVGVVVIQESSNYYHAHRVLMPSGETIEIDKTAAGPVVIPLDEERNKLPTEAVSMHNMPQNEGNVNKENAEKRYSMADDDLNAEETYTYAHLTAQPNMRVVRIGELSDYMKNGKIDRDAVKVAGIANAINVGRRLGETVAGVKNVYTGREIEISGASIRHGLDGQFLRVSVNSKLGAVIGDLAQNAIPVNSMYAEKGGIEYTYPMIAWATDGKDDYLAFLHIDRHENHLSSVDLLDIAHSLNGRIRKNSATALMPTRHTDGSSAPSNAVSVVSIAEVLELVKELHPDILSEDVLEHFDIHERPSGYYNGRVKFSLIDTADADVERLQRDNERLQRTVENLASQFKIIRGFHASDEMLAQLGRKLLKEYGSTYSLDSLRQNLRTMLDYIADADEPSWEDITKLGVGMAKEIVKQSQELDHELYDNYADARAYLKGTRIILSDVQRGEARYMVGSYGNYRGKLFGSVNLVSTDGIQLDQAWQRLAEMNPELFDPDATEGDQVAGLYDAVQQMKPQYINPYGMDIDGVAYDLFLKIFDRYFDMPDVRRAARDAHELAKMQARSKENIAMTREDMKKAYDRRLLELRKESIQRRQEAGKKWQEAKEKGNAEAEKKYMTQFRRLQEAYTEKLMQQRAAYSVLSEYKKADRAQRIEHEQLVKYRNRIESGAKQLSRWLQAPTEQRHVPEVMRNTVYTFLESLDFSGKSNVRTQYWKDNLQAVKDYMSNADAATVAGETDAYIDIDPEFADQVQQLMQYARGNKSIMEMDAEHLKLLDTIVTKLKAACQNVNTILVDGRRQAIESFAVKAIEKAEAAGMRENNRFTNSALGNLLTAGNIKPIYFFRHIGGPMQQLFDEIRKGQTQYAFHLQEAKDYYESVSERYNAKKWLNKPGDVLKITTARGDTFELTRDEALALYAISNREARNQSTTAAKHLQAGGFVFNRDVKVTDKKGKEKSVRYGTPHPLNAQDMMKIKLWLTDEQRAYADELVRYMSTDLAALGNEVSMKTMGVKRFTEQYYFPYKSSRDFIASAPGKMNAQVSRLMNKGFTKQTVAFANNPIVLQGFTEVFGGHVNDMLMYNAMAIPQENMLRVYNWTAGIDERVTSTSVKVALQNAYGEHAKGYVDTFLADLNGDIVADPREQLGTKLLSRFKRGAVMANLSVAIQQPSAIVRAAALIDPRYFFGKPRTGSYEEAKMYAGTAIIKDVGGFDTATGRGAAQWVTELKSNKVIDRYFMEYVDKIGGYLPNKMDEITWGAIWEACKRETAEKTGLKGEELLKATGERFDEVIELTQVYDSVITRSQLMRSKSGIVQMATSFMAEPTVTFNMLYDMLTNKEAKTKLKAARTLPALIGSVIFNSLLKSVVYAMRDDDDQPFIEKYIESVVGSLTGEPFDDWGKMKWAGYLLTSELSPASMIPYIKDIVAIFGGYDVKRTDMSVIVDLQRAIKILGKENVSVAVKIDTLAGAIGNLCGVPYRNASRDVKAVYKTADDIIRKDQKVTARGVRNALIEAVGADNSIKTNVQALYAASRKGNQAQMKKAIDEISALYDDKVKQLIRAGQSKEAAEKAAKTSIQSACTKILRELYREARTAGERTQIKQLALRILIGRRQLYSGYDFNKKWK